ncbi:MAG: hypothetical protein QF473_19945 [Planctomycetota bacterium]|jgi:hypothetical protein|nr:hypothetical protein [Planctomycetota bacterium]
MKFRLLSTCIFMYAAFLGGPVALAEAPAISRADYVAAQRKIAAETRRKPMAAYTAYLKYLDGTPGLYERMRFDLYRYLLTSAFAAGEAEYAKTLARFLAEPDGVNKTNGLYNFLREFAKGGAPAAAETAKLFAAHGDKLNLQQRLIIRAAIAGNGLRLDRDIEGFRKHLEACKTLTDPNAKDERARNRAKNAKAEAMAGMLSELMKYDLGEAKSLIDTNAALFSEAQKLTLAKGSAMAALFVKDRAAFDAALSDFQKTADAVARLRHYLELTRQLARDDRDAAEKILRSALKDPAYNDAHRHQLLSMLRGLNRVRRFNYHFHVPGSYEKFKSLAEEDLKAIERGLAEGTIKRDYNLAFRTYFDIAAVSADFGDYAFARKMLSEARRDYPLDYRFVPLAVRLALRANSMERVRVVVTPILKNPKEREDNKRFLKGVMHVYGGKPLVGFDAAVFGEAKASSADRLIMLRRVSEMLFFGGHYELCRMIRREIFSNRFTPPAFKSYEVKYVKDAPKTADAWARSDLYDKWNLMETRFVPYGEAYDINSGVDIKRHLKDAKQPEVDATYRTGVHIVCDDFGLHIFVRCDDPNVKEVVLGKRKGDSLEMLFRPGEDAAYHMWFFGAAPVDNEDPWVVDWATPSRRYRMTRDFLRKDSAATADGFVAHTWIPWTAVYDKLPTDGNVWKFGMQRWGKARATLSGNVHELERALRLKFAFTPQELISVKRTIAIMSFNRYDKVRQNKGEFIQTWNDRVLGDPNFYKAEVESLIAELDAAGEKLMAPAPDAEIAAIYDRYVPLWAEIRYVIADRRAAYLKRQLLK